MITGDHPLTAEAIARRLGMLTGATAREVAAAEGVGEESVHPFRHPSVCAAVVSGHELAQLSAQDVDALLLLPEVVFARTSPDQKAAMCVPPQRSAAQRSARVCWEGERPLPRSHAHTHTTLARHTPHATRHTPHTALPAWRATSALGL